MEVEADQEVAPEVEVDPVLVQGKFYYSKYTIIHVLTYIFFVFILTTDHEVDLNQDRQEALEVAVAQVSNNLHNINRLIYYLGSN